MLKRSGAKGAEQTLQYGALCIRLLARSATLADKALSLTPKEFELLATLAQNERVVLTREQLLDKVWGYQYFGVARTVDTHVKSIRDQLGAYRGIIQTVWGVGYKFEYQAKA